MSNRSVINLILSALSGLMYVVSGFFKLIARILAGTNNREEIIHWSGPLVGKGRTLSGKVEPITYKDGRKVGLYSGEQIIQDL